MKKDKITTEIYSQSSSELCSECVEGTRLPILKLVRLDQFAVFVQFELLTKLFLFNYQEKLLFKLKFPGTVRMIRLFLPTEECVQGKNYGMRRFQGGGRQIHSPNFWAVQK